MRAKRYKASFVLGWLMCAPASLVAAHDFWLQPNDYWIAPNATDALTLQVGHGPQRQRSPIARRRIVRFQALDPHGSTSELQRFDKPGTYVLVMQTDNRAQSHLPAARFNDYLVAEGLTPALEQRARSHSTSTDGSERYSRCAKALVQVGPSIAGARNQVTRPVGLPLEIVPDINPYDTPRSATLPIHVLYEGRPLPFALVKLTDLGNDAAPLEQFRTDRKGRASFTMPTSGKWLLNVIWTKALPQTEETDFETVFSSLSFGFDTKVQ